MSRRKSLRLSVEDLFSKNTDYKYPEQAINQAESLKSLSNDLYTDNIRFIYELIQNADDAQANQVILTILDNKYLIVAHNGKSFDEKDLQGLCGVNNGTKRKDLNKTGYKGLGFKAVFGKSDKVILYSDGEYFRFDSSYQIPWNQQWGTKDQQTWERENDRQFIYPWQINPIWTDQNDVPHLIRTFLHAKQNQIQVATIILLNNVKEILQAIHQLKEQPYMFLFLRNISQITFLTESIDTISITTDARSSTKTVYVNQTISSQWIIKRLELDVPDDIREKLAKDSKAPEKLRLIQKAEMFFAAKSKNGYIIEKLHDKESHLFSYLPTKVFDYIFPIIINANFLTNANREQIHTDSAWNQWLFCQIGLRLFEWIRELVLDDQFHCQAYQIIPMKLKLANNSLSDQFNVAFDWSILNCPFIRNRKNKLLTVNEVIMDSTEMSEQSSFINIDSMRQFAIDHYKGNYAQHPFIDYDQNLFRIGVRYFTWKICIQMFGSDQFLQTHSLTENKQMINYFYSKRSNLAEIDEMDIPIQQIPFLMDQNNRLQSIENIYFPAETIGDSGTIDSDDLFVNKIIFDWLNDYQQIRIKSWLKELGVDERTDLTYLRKTIIPNASTYTTPENAIKTIRMLFRLFQKHHIEKVELIQLKELKLLTTRGTLTAAEQCFFSKKYNPHLSIETFLTTKEDKFLSPDYITDDIDEWNRFFKIIGVRDELYLIHYKEKIDIQNAIQYGFDQEFLIRRSPNGTRPAYGYSGLKTIIFLKHTRDNYGFAQLFWSFVIEKMQPSDFDQSGTRVYWRSENGSGGTELSDLGYIKWFVQHIPCIPTIQKNCQLSVNTFIDTNELKQLCGIYLPIIDISSQEHLHKWITFFHLKTKFSLSDYLQLLDHIRKDESNLMINQDRIQNIYSHLLDDSTSWSIDQQIIYLLAENNQWKLASELYLYADGGVTNSRLNDIVPCLKLNSKNRSHPDLTRLTELFHIKQIKMNDLKLVCEDSNPAEDFREKLIEISPYLKIWLASGFGSDIIASIDRILQQETRFIEGECLKLYYNKNFIQETNAYFDSIEQDFYLTRPWHSETTLIDLPKKLCQLLNIQGFEDNVRFLLKGEEKEIVTKFKKLSLKLPSSEDTIRLELITRSDLQTRLKLSDNDESMSDEQSSLSDSEDLRMYTRESSTDDVEMYSKRGHMALSNDHRKFLNIFSESTRSSNKRKRKRLITSNDSVDELSHHLDLIDLSTISNSSSAPIKTSFNRNRIGGNGQTDMHTGLTGEQFVHKYLLNKYHYQLDSVSIEWLNRNQEASLPYDFLLIENGIKHYIEVKTTRTINQHTFFLSINQIKAILQHGENYQIYRVYLKQKKLIILNNIESLLKDRNQLALLLTMNVKSLDQSILTDE